MRHDNVVGRSPARQPTSERYSQPAAEWESGGRIKRGEYEFVLVRIARNTAIHYWVITGQYSATFFFGTNIIRLLFRKQNRDLVKKVAQSSCQKAVSFCGPLRRYITCGLVWFFYFCFNFGGRLTCFIDTVTDDYVGHELFYQLTYARKKFIRDMTTKWIVWKRAQSHSRTG